MWRNNQSKSIITFMCGLGLGLGVASLPPSIAQDNKPQAPETAKAEAPPHRALDANLYIQTAAEYRACCLQAYNVATAQLQERLKVAKNPAQCAVVLDLDETVFDNAGFQTMLLRSRLAYNQTMWDGWEAKHSEHIGLVPGALEFLQKADKLGVAVIYISNRAEQFKEPTKAALKRLQLPLKDDNHLKLMTTTTNKTARRTEVEAVFQVLLYVGDNLRDFEEGFRFPEFGKKLDPAELDAAISERKSKVDKAREQWGTRWIILPNPAYGEWTKPLGHEVSDYDRLVPTILPKK